MAGPGALRCPSPWAWRSPRWRPTGAAVSSPTAAGARCWSTGRTSGRSRRRRGPCAGHAMPMADAAAGRRGRQRSGSDPLPGYAHAVPIPRPLSVPGPEPRPGPDRSRDLALERQRPGPDAECRPGARLRGSQGRPAGADLRSPGWSAGPRVLQVPRRPCRRRRRAGVVRHDQRDRMAGPRAPSGQHGRAAGHHPQRFSRRRKDGRSRRDHALPRARGRWRSATPPSVWPSPRRVRFRYRLEGVDADWVEAGTRRQAFYTNLKPGKYVFRVRAANNDGVWNEQGASLALDLPPTLVQSRLFLVLCAVVAAGLLVAVYRWRMRALGERLQARPARADGRA
ncbi:triple tyrosine motif-containing protein [Caulobacter segnis]